VNRASIFGAVVLLFLFSAAPLGAQATLTNVNGASFSGGSLAPESIVTARGQNLARTTESAEGGQLSVSLGGTSVGVVDSLGNQRFALLYFVSPQQVNYVLPPGTPPGPATVRIANAAGQVSTGTILVEPVSPGIFTANADGRGVPAAQIVRVRTGGTTSYEDVFTCGASGACRAARIDPGGDEVFLILYGTGIRGRSSLAAVQATVGGLPAEVLYAGPQNEWPGLDQVNLRLSPLLPRNQLATITLSVDGKAANPTTLLLSDGSPLPGAATVRFDPSSPATGPFPTDFLTVADAAQATGLRVNLPLPDCAVEPSTCQEIRLLNELDGFNLQPRVSIQFSGAVEPATLQDGILFVWLDQVSNGEPGLRPQGHVTRANQVVYDPATNTAYAKPNDPFDQHRRYALLVTDAVRDPAGIPAAPDPGFRACITAPQNDYCMRLSQAVAAAEGAAAPGQIVAASVFTTLSATAWLEKAWRQVQNTPPEYRPAAPISIFETARLVSFTWRQHIGTNPPQFNDVTVPAPALVAPGVRRIAFGSYRSPGFLDDRRVIPNTPTGEGAAVPPASTQEIFFHAYLPDGSKPAAGYPVVLFGHGYRDSSFASPTLVASKLAEAGFATLAINAFGHGLGRDGRIILTEFGRITEIPSGGRSVDTNGDGRIEDKEGCLIYDPPVGVRDCIRQTAIDLAQLAHAVRTGIDLDGDGTPDLDGARIYYAGISLGAIYGTVFTALEPAVRAAALNVGGGSIVDIARLGDSFRSEARTFLAMRTPPLLNAGAEFNEDYVLRNRPVKVTTVPGAIAIQNFFERLEWLQVSGDPTAYAPHLKTSPLPGNVPRPVLWQFALGDQTVPNPATSNLIRGADQRDSAVLYRHDLARPLASYLPEDPHTFLVNITPPGGLAIASVAQEQITGFLRSDGASIPDANTTAINILFLGRRLFERPADLPEDLNF
jgi:uncharacterized protein (TIGR03437 family)